MQNWKKVSNNLVYGHDNVWASKDGCVKVNDKIIKAGKGPKGKDGTYKICTINGRTMFFHRLVYYAFSDKAYDTLLNSRIIFRPFQSEMVDNYGFYRSYLEDLLIEECKNPSLLSYIPENETIKRHPIYGIYSIGKWYEVYGHRYLRETQYHCVIHFPMLLTSVV